jgi:hypothetical protein
MMKSLLSIVILTAAASRAADNLVPLDAKPGLWEITTVTERSGMPTIPADTLAKLPPEQRARMEAQLKAMSGTTTETKQSCITPEEMTKGFAWNNSTMDKSCRQTITSSSGSRTDIKWECDGQNKNSGSAKIQAIDSNHVNSVIEINMSANGHAMNMKVTNTGKWLGTACGDVKPNSGKKE